MTSHVGVERLISSESPSSPRHFSQGTRHVLLEEQLVPDSFGSWDGFSHFDVLTDFNIRPFMSDFSLSQTTGLKAEDVVLSLNTHIPSKALIDKYALTVVHYDDSTVEQIVRDPNYYWSSLTEEDHWVFQKERDALEHSHAVVGMTEYASDAMQRLKKKLPFTLCSGAPTFLSKPQLNRQERHRGRRFILVSLPLIRIQRSSGAYQGC